MPTTLTYNHILHAPTTAKTQLVPTRRYARYAEPHPVPPLKGLQEPRAASVFYRAFVPAGHAGCEVALSYHASSLYGETLSFEIKGSPSTLPQSIPNSEFLIPNWTYTFSAKERDPETGLSYFGSRYYSSDLSIWLSVDPMTAKYPSLSPYTYCADNPVKLVDPNGEDIWEINNETGKVTRTKDNTQDVIRVVDNDGNVIKDKDGNLQTLSYKYGTIRHYTTKKDGYDVFRIRGDGNGTDLFELMANNTNIEWSQFKTGIAGEQGLNFITTGHTDEGDPAATNLYNKQLQYKYYIREFIHYHPGRMPVPSGMLGTIQEGTGDISFVSKINRNNIRFGYKIPTYKIFAKSFGYNEYNANSQVPDFECIYDLYGRRPRMKE